MNPHVLMAAYQCGPGMGSVSQIGWEWYDRTRKTCSVTLITHIRNKTALEAAGAPVNTSQIHFVDTEWLARPLYAAASSVFKNSEHATFLLSSADYFLYDWLAARWASRRRKQYGWDLTHVVTPVSTVAPTHLTRLGIPAILGPLNAGLATPQAFEKTLGGDAAWLYPLRGFGRAVDRLIGSSRRAARVLTATRATRRSLPREAAAAVVPLIENGVDLGRFAPSKWPGAPGPGRPLRLCFVGRLVPFKGLPMLLEAMARTRYTHPTELAVVGTGPMLSDWKRLAEDLSIGDRVTFKGALPLPEVAHEMRRSHLHCLPSVRESGGAVILEAMACGRPTAAVAYGGPAEILTNTFGAPIAPDGEEAVTNAFCDVFADVYRNPDAWEMRGILSRQEAEIRYGWDAKINRAQALYSEVLT